MDNIEHPSFIMVPANHLERIEKEIHLLRRSVDTVGSLHPKSQKEWIPKMEFQALVGIKNTKFHELQTNGRIPSHLLRKIGRKLYVHKEVVDLYFNGEL